jgi:hypothetical protein
MERMVGTWGLEPQTSTVSKFAYPVPTTTSMKVVKLQSPSKYGKAGQSRAGITGWNCPWIHPLCRSDAERDVLRACEAIKVAIMAISSRVVSTPKMHFGIEVFGCGFFEEAREG